MPEGLEVRIDMGEEEDSADCPSNDGPRSGSARLPQPSSLDIRMDSYFPHDEAAILHMKEELGAWVYLTGYWIDTTNMFGKLCFILFHTSLAITLITHGVVGATTAVVVATDNPQYCYCLVFLTLYSFWASTIPISFLLLKRLPLILHSAMSKPFAYTDETETGTTRIKRYHKILKEKFDVTAILFGITVLIGIFFQPLKPMEYLPTNLPLPAYYPISVEPKLICFIVSVFQLFDATLTIAFCECGIYFFANYSFHWATDMERLKNSITCLDQRALNLYRIQHPDNVQAHSTMDMDSLRMDDGYVDCYIYCFRENILHHYSVRRFHDQLQDYAAFSLGTILIFSSLVIGSLIVFISEGTILFPGVLLCATLGGLFMASIIGNSMVEMAIELRQAVFETSWPTSHKRVIPYVSMMLEVTKTLKRPCFMGFIYYDKPAFLAILQAAYSYYNFLHIAGQRLASGN